MTNRQNKVMRKQLGALFSLATMTALIDGLASAFFFDGSLSGRTVRCRLEILCYLAFSANSRPMGEEKERNSNVSIERSVKVTDIKAALVDVGAKLLLYAIGQATCNCNVSPPWRGMSGKRRPPWQALSLCHNIENRCPCLPLSGPLALK